MTNKLIQKDLVSSLHNLSFIYSLSCCVIQIFRPQYSRETGEACSVSAEALLQYMGQHGFLRLNKEQVVK